MKLWSYLLAALSSVAFAAPGPYSVTQIVAKSGEIRTGNIPLPHLSPGHNYTFLFSIAAPSALNPVVDDAGQGLFVLQNSAPGMITLEPEHARTMH